MDVLITSPERSDRHNLDGLKVVDKKGATELRRLPIRLKAGIRRSILLQAIAVGLCCSAGLLVTAGRKLNQVASVDPYTYAGFIHDYRDLLERFGPTYYSERIAFIYPERVLAHLFGLEGGYFAFRFIVLASAVAAVFAIGRRFYGLAPAALAAVWISFMPWLPRALLWTYPDGTAVAYMLLAIAFLLVPTKRRLLGHVVAGCCFMLAVNCNLTLVEISIWLAPGWIFFNRHESVFWIARALLALALGFVGTYLALALFLYIKFPVYGFSFEIATVREALSLLGGRGKTWYKPLATIVWQEKNFLPLVPVAFALSAAMVAVRHALMVGGTNERREFAVLAGSYLASVVCFTLILHFILQDSFFSAYMVFLLPGCVLALIALAGEAERRGGPFFGTGAVVGGAGLILIWWLAHPILPDLQIASNFYLWLIIACLTVVAAAAMVFRGGIASAGVVGGTALLSMGIYQAGIYQIRSASAADQTIEWDVYRGAMFLQHFVNANVHPNEPLGFWYTGDIESPLNSVQSVYLWDYTRVFSHDGPGMPLIDAHFRNRIAEGMLPVSGPVTSLILLGVSDAETDAGLAALEKSGLPFAEATVTRARYQGHAWGYTAALIQMKPSTRTIGPLLHDVQVATLDARGELQLPIEGFRAINGASISFARDGLALTTASAQWSYSFVEHLQSALKNAHGPVVVRMRLRVEEGMIGVAVSSRGNISDLIRREDGIRADQGWREIYLPISDAGAADLLIIQNESQSGVSRAALRSLEVLRAD